MQIIPYDVWRHITSFLSPEEVKKLYSVNASLLSIALDERYRTASIGSLSTLPTERSLNRLIDAEISSRVRAFTLKPGHLCKLLRESESKQSEQTDTVSGLLTAFGSLTLKPRKALMISSNDKSRMVVHAMPVHLAQRNVLKIMMQMTSLTSLRVEIGGEEHWFFQATSIDFFAPGWATFGANLRALELRIPLEDMAKVLPPVEKVTLTSLTTLSLQIIRASLTTNEIAIMTEILLPFINTHHRILKSLTLDVAEHTNMSPFLLELTPMASLSSFKLKQPFVSQEQTDFTGLKHFFQMHRLHLTRFDIEMISTFTHYPTPYPFFTQHCFSVSLPRLRHLSIHLQHFPLEYSEGMLPYIHQFKSTLVSLEVYEHRWPLERLQMLVEGFSPTPMLRELKISLTDFTPQVLITLANKFPDLDALHLDFGDIGPEGYYDPSARDKPLFADVLDRLVFPRWHLSILHLNKPLHLKPSSRLHCKSALVKALPNVETFCGLPGEEYISTAAFL